MTIEWVVVAEGQAGIISTRQLIACGVTRATLAGLTRRGLIERVSRGVYQLPATSRGWHGALWVGLLEAGEGAFLCQRSAAALWQLDGVAVGAVDIAVPMGRRPRRAGTIRMSAVDPAAVTIKAGMPVTTVARTLIDLGGVVDVDVVERSLECSLRRKLVSLDDLEQALVRYRSRGSPVLRRVLSQRPADAFPTESDAETLFVILARTAGLPAHRRQYRVVLRGRVYRVDFAWPEARLAVEIDGRSFHGPDQLDGDLYRQNQLMVDGWVILRFTWRQVVKFPAVVVRDFVAVYERRSMGVA